MADFLQALVLKAAGRRRAQLCDWLRRNACKPQSFALRQPAMKKYRSERKGRPSLGRGGNLQHLAV
jgi:hypothetical protein